MNKSVLLSFSRFAFPDYFLKEKGKKESHRKCRLIARRKRNKSRRVDWWGTSQAIMP